MEDLLHSLGAGVSRVIVHDAVKGPFASFGSTSSGTSVRLNAVAMEADAFVVLSDMKPHYFAGYSCPPKFIFPGLAAIESIEANHAFTFDPASRAGFHPWHPDARRRANPLAADYVEAYGLAVAGRPAVALAFGSSGEEIFWAEAGTLPEATARGIVRADEIGHVVTAPARFAVISPGGFPNDVDLYIAQRALELCGDAVEDGGDILFLCECQGGIGPAHAVPVFWDPLKGNLRAAASGPRGPYRLYAHKAVRFARLMLRLAALHLHTSLPADEVASAHMVAVTDPQAVIGEWLAMDPDARILLFDGANKLSVSLP
jgi:nickel-dependent lactate racemase